MKRNLIQSETDSDPHQLHADTTAFSTSLKVNYCSIVKKYEGAPAASIQFNPL